MNIFNGFLYYSLLTFTFCSIDRILNKYYKGNYYLIHGISNMFITILCVNDVKQSYLNLNTIAGGFLMLLRRLLLLILLLRFLRIRIYFFFL